mmetsp:Transcript_4508/g.10912  ORF Transcript_4508/g.10912 Transcript_4508/m.10912 type:complete len:259 (+) Transcript_4508:953-1729(+)
MHLQADALPPVGGDLKLQMFDLHHPALRPAADDVLHRSGPIAGVHHAHRCRHRPQLLQGLRCTTSQRLSDSLSCVCSHHNRNRSALTRLQLCHDSDHDVVLQILQASMCQRAAGTGGQGDIQGRSLPEVGKKLVCSGRASGAVLLRRKWREPRGVVGNMRLGRLLHPASIAELTQVQLAIRARKSRGEPGELVIAILATLRPQLIRSLRRRHQVTLATIHGLSLSFVDSLHAIAVCVRQPSIRWSRGVGSEGYDFGRF